MDKEEISAVLNEQFLIEIVQIIGFNVDKSSAKMNVLCVEGRGTVDKKYSLEFNEVVSFNYSCEPWNLRNGELETDVDDKKVMDSEERKGYWQLSINSAGFNLDIVFKSVVKTSIP